jgi:hypothetical protein
MQRSVILDAKVFRVEPVHNFSDFVFLVLRTQSFLQLIVWEILVHLLCTFGGGMTKLITVVRGSFRHFGGFLRFVARLCRVL